MTDRKRIILVDGHALAYRSHFAFIRNPLINSRGVNTSASYGFISTILRIRDEADPDLFVVTFDTPEPTFRHKSFKEYKATREKMPDDMRAQMAVIDRLVKALGLPVVTAPGYEADDVMATLARQGAERGDDVTLLSADKDLMQLVNERITLHNPWARAGTPERFGPKEVEAKMGVPPDRIIDLLALMGDSSDNIPGVPGIGEKTARKLLADFGSLEELLTRSDEVKARRARENLSKHRDSAELSRDLVTLDDKVPLERGLADLTPGEEDRDTLNALFQELEFKDLHKRFSQHVESRPHEYRVITSDAELDALIAQLREAGEFVFDLETTSLDPALAEVVGIAFCIEEGKAVYVPTLGSSKAPPAPKAGETGSLFPEEPEEEAKPSNGWLEKLKPLLEDEGLKKGGQNLKYDLRVCGERGITVRGVAFDTLLESYVLDPASRTRNIDDLALRYLSYRKIATKELIGAGRHQVSMADLPIEVVARYASEDVDICLRLHKLFVKQLAAAPALEALYKEVELPLLPVLVRMEQAGISIDTKVLAELSTEFEDKANALLAKAHELAGVSFNLNSPKQLREVLYDKLDLHTLTKVRPKRTGGGKLSTDVSVLERMAEKHPLPQVILDYRSFTKLKGTYVDSLPKLRHPLTGRIHTSFNQAVAATGRLSSSDPNLQNIPIRTPEGMRIRGAFIAGDGLTLMAADYSQVELRLLAHLSKEEALVEAFREGADIHRATAARIFKVEAEDVTSEQRGRAKAINFGIIYGMGPSRLARQTGISKQEAEAFIEGYFATYPKVRAWLDGQIALAESQGYVETLLGRRRELPEITNANPQLRANAERMATNTPIQGSAADIIKLAMLKIDAALQAPDAPGRMLLQVHDELVFEAPEDRLDELEALVRGTMEGVMELEVPLTVEVGRGRSWLEAH